MARRKGYHRVLEKKLTSESVAIPYRVMIQGTLQTSDSANAKNIIMAAIEGPAARLPGAEIIRVSATTRIHKQGAVNVHRGRDFEDDEEEPVRRTRPLGNVGKGRTKRGKGGLRYDPKRRALSALLSNASRRNWTPERLASAIRDNGLVSLAKKFEKWPEGVSEEEIVIPAVALPGKVDEPQPESSGPTLSDLRTSATHPKASSRQVGISFFRRRASKGKGHPAVDVEGVATVNGRRVIPWDALCETYVARDERGSYVVDNVTEFCRANKIYPADLYSNLAKRGITLRTKVKPETIMQR